MKNHGNCLWLPVNYVVCILKVTQSSVLDGAVNDMLNQYWRELSADLFNEVKQEMLTILKAVLDGILRVFPISLVVLD